MKFLRKVKQGINKFASKIANVFTALKNRMNKNKLWSLVSMQLKDKWNFSFKTNKKGAIFKIITYIVVFAMICGFVYLLMYIAGVRLQIFSSSTIPLSAMVVIITVVSVFELISIIIGLTKNLYFAKDNPVLITYPVKADTLFLSKIIVFMIDAIKKGFVLFVPILVGYGIIRGLPFYYYLWSTLWVIVYIIVLTLISGFLSIPTYYVMRFMKKYRSIKIIFALVVLGLIIWLSIVILNAIPNNINIIKEYEKFSKMLAQFLIDFSNAVPFMVAVTGLFCGAKVGMSYSVFSSYSYIVPLVFFGLIIVFIVVNKFVAKPFYIKMISNNNIQASKAIKARRRNSKTPNKNLAVLRYELLRNFKDEKVIISSIIFIVLTPIIMILANKFYCSFDVRISGERLILTFNYLFIILLATAHNFTSSYIFSKDGPSWNINKSLPINPRISLTLRLTYNFVISIIIIVMGALIYGSYQGASAYDICFLIISVLLLSTFHSFLSASYDFMHSKEKSVMDIGNEYIDKHITVSMVYSLLISVISSAFIFLLYYLDTPNVFLRISLIGVFCLALEVWLFLKRIRALYQES